MRVGYTLDQTSTEDNDLTYWQIRFIPYGYAEMDYKPFLNFNLEEFIWYSDFNTVVDAFEAGLFGEIVFWWDWSSIGSNTRSFCWGAGYNVDEITFTYSTQFYTNDCYKTLIRNMMTPFEIFNRSGEGLFEWTECDQSEEANPTLFEYNWFDTTAEQEVYWIGADATVDSGYCLANLFSENKVAANLFDLAISTFWSPDIKSEKH